MAQVAISNVHKTFGAENVIKGVSLAGEDGEFVVLVGPSGCGKSTLLRMIAGLESVSEGEIRIDGRLINEVPPADRDIAMVFQNYALYPHMSVEENLAFCLKLRGEPKSEVKKKIARAAEILGLTALLSRYPRELSGGQRQRVAMGRALVRDPRVFLFDEPLSNLDSKLRVQMRTEIKALQRQLKTTTVYVTHDQIEAMTMADRIVVMNRGLVEQIGAPLELYDRPANLFVAGFIGSPGMNLLNGTVHASAGTLAVELGNDLRIPLHGGAALAAGQEVTLGIRPEHLKLADGDEGLPIELQVVEPTGAETLIHASLGRTSIVVTSAERLAARPGDVIRVRADAARWHVFDRATGRRLE